MADFNGDISGLPTYGIYLQQQAAAQKAWDDAQVSIKNKQGRLAQDSGFNVSYKDDGNVDKYSVDGLNLLGGYQRMMRGHGQELESIRDSARSRNIGGFGIARQPEQDARYGMAGEEASFGKNFLDQNADLAQQRAQAYSTYQQQLNQARLDAIMNAIQMGYFAPSSSGTVTDGGKTKIPSQALPDPFANLGKLTQQQITSLRQKPGGDLHYQYRQTGRPF